jgi:hypothetical protein
MLADVNKKLIFAKRMFKDKRRQRAKQKKEIKNLKFIIFLDLVNNKFILLVYNKLNSFFTILCYIKMSAVSKNRL